MKKTVLLSLWITTGFVTLVSACTSFIATPGATVDGSVYITYTCDAEFHPYIEVIPAADHEPDTMVGEARWAGRIAGKVKQVPHTYAVLGSSSSGLMNDQQVSIGETTFGGRGEMFNPEGLFGYPHLMILALQRSSSARQAIEVIGELVKDYGYRGPGESFSIGDKNEAWIMEIIGPGKGGEGAVWVARRIPDGFICCHANKARIGEFPLNDPENCLYSENVISVAVDKGLFDPESGAAFNFHKAYDPDNCDNRHYAGSRVWSIFHRAAPSLNLSTDYCRGVAGAQPYPLWIKPDTMLTTQDVFSLMRDHYEGTEFDMTLGVGAGPFGNPNRWRDIDWQVDGETYSWERPISTPQTAYSMVAQMRASLPNPVGGVLWFGMDDTYTTCYTPLYSCVDVVPPSFDAGNLEAFTWDSAWWTFNLVANYACLKYSYMIQDIQAAQSDIEGELLALQAAVEATAASLYQSDPALMKRYLTDYSVSHGETTVERWRALAKHLITKYNDGFIHGRGVGYPESWLRKVLQDEPKPYRWESTEETQPGEKPL